MKLDLLNRLSTTSNFSVRGVDCIDLDGQSVKLPKDAEALRNALESFDGDVYRFLKIYYRAVSELPLCLPCDAVRLLDAAQIWSGCFDADDLRYRKYLLDATDRLIESDTVFEVGIREMPMHGALPICYPSVIALRRIGERRGRVTLSATAHPTASCMRNVIALLRSCGIGSVYLRNADGWDQYSI